MHKCYGIHYTRAMKRVAVLNVVTDAHVDILLLSLTRYISHRGCPKQVLTDSFCIEQSTVICGTKKYKMDFSPWRSPVVWCGFWGRLVGSVKICIKKTTGCTCLTFTEMRTLFFELEHYSKLNILNSRPLTALFDDDDNEQIVTPNHLLYGWQLAYANEDNKNMIKCDEKFTKHINNIKLMFCTLVLDTMEKRLFVIITSTCNAL